MLCHRLRAADMRRAWDTNSSTKWKKNLEFYSFPPPVEADKRAFIEHLYESINEVSEVLLSSQCSILLAFTIPTNI